MKKEIFDQKWITQQERSSPIERRYLLSLFYSMLCDEVQKQHGVERDKASSFVRLVWNEASHSFSKKYCNLPGVIHNDGFLRMYAQATPLSSSFVDHLQKLIQIWRDPGHLSPLFFGRREEYKNYFNVDATPSGLLGKFFYSFRVKRDGLLLEKIQSDLNEISRIQERGERELLTLAVLAHAASYREIGGQIVQLPSLATIEPGVTVPYRFEQHFLWEGVKTISAFPMVRQESERGIYLCQGTEIWPSQPATLSSIIANLGKEGCATEPYAHSERAIHEHLRNLTHSLPPLVAGHSMGGALATQIALYSPSLIEKAYAFNPPTPGERDYEFYRGLPKDIQEKLHVFVNIDDLPFWRIGSHVIGKVTCFLGERRWPYKPLRRWEFLFIVPAFIKMILNLINALPAHQRIIPLLRSYLYFSFSPEEIEIENRERTTRFDHIDFFPKLHESASSLLRAVRRTFPWRMREEYLKSQIRLLELHEKDLRESLKRGERAAIKAQIEKLQKEKEKYLKETKSFEHMP